MIHDRNIALRRAVAVPLLTWLCGCGASAGSLAAADFRCSEDDLVVREVADGMYRITGCGQTALYSCGGGSFDLSMRGPFDPPPTFGPRGPFRTTASESKCNRVIETRMPAATASSVSTATSARAPDPPAGAGGFAFGEPPGAAQSRCNAAGHQWTADATSATCSGTPADVGIPASARLGFCNGSVCRVDLLTEAGTDDIRHRFDNIKHIVEMRHGPATKDSSVVPDVCAARTDPCIRSGQASLRVEWRWQTGHSIVMQVLTSTGFILQVSYRSPLAQDSSAI